MSKFPKLQLALHSFNNVVFDSHIHCLVLATEETMVTQQVSSWPRRGTKVDGLHHGDSPLLKPTGIQIRDKTLAKSTTQNIGNLSA